MMLTVSLMSKQEGEIKKFLDKHYNKSEADDSVIEWIYVCRDIDKGLNLIDTIMDNNSKYNLSVWVKVDDDDIIEVTSNSRHKITNEIKMCIENN